jgi:hypothetical protein
MDRRLRRMPPRPGPAGDRWHLRATALPSDIGFFDTVPGAHVGGPDKSTGRGPDVPARKAMAASTVPDSKEKFMNF